MTPSDARRCGDSHRTRCALTAGFRVATSACFADGTPTVDMAPWSRARRVDAVVQWQHHLVGPLPLVRGSRLEHSYRDVVPTYQRVSLRRSLVKRETSWRSKAGSSDPSNRRTGSRTSLGVPLQGGRGGEGRGQDGQGWSEAEIASMPMRMWRRCWRCSRGRGAFLTKRRWQCWVRKF